MQLKLELSQQKTLITHARTGVARFLGTDRTPCPSGDSQSQERPLPVPRQTAKRKALINSSDHAIVATFGAVYRGIVQYYLLAGDVFRLHRLRWVMETSVLKALAAQHRSSASKMAAKYKTRIDTLNGPRVCFEARIERKNRKPLVARFGGIPLQHQRSAKITEPMAGLGGLSARRADHSAPGAGWPPSDGPRVMLDRRRKTVVACDICHDRIHQAQAARLFTP
ncbi:group II intron reverse transcriptase/maturase [Streptomyces sp. SD31]|uniref:group II intron reverse transcriptase/maturase n=1 Tax=Streptomyces sp. SD31 TaxID=3452208 RepID=UPI003F8B53FB